MTPDKIIKGMEFHNKDCMAVMAEYPDKHFDLAIVDPPYGIGVNHNMGRRAGDLPSDYKKVVWDDKPPDQDYFRELFRVSKNQVVFGANHFIDKISKPSPCWIVWDKMFSEDVSFAMVELAWTSFESVSKKITLHPSQQLRIHPTQKPATLYGWILDGYAQPGFKILDTHLGSGSIAVACYNHHMSLVGAELDKDYFDAAMSRIERETAQMLMI